MARNQTTGPCRSEAPSPRMARLGRVALFACLLLTFPPLIAADYYFSDCPAGGQGTITSPWCLDPNGDGRRDSVMHLFDGSDPEARPGDRIHLCAGACDGAGSATFHVQCTGIDIFGRTFWFRASTGGSAAAPIVIQAYVNAGTGARETVVISGDSNADGAYQPNAGACTSSVDIDSLITNVGKPSVYALQWKNFTLEKSGNIMVTLDDTSYNNTNGPNDWLFDGMTLRYGGSEIWNGALRDFYSAGCTQGSQHFAMKVRGVTGNFTVRNSTIHSICGFAHRNTNNDGGGGNFLFEGNEYYNLGVVNNDFLNISSDGTRWARFTWRGLWVHDANQGLSVEDRTRDVVIEDSTFACLGQYKTREDGRCAAAIKVSDGDNAGQGGTTSGVTIRRNKVFSVATSPAFSPASCPSSACGWFLEGITWVATCDPGRLDGCTSSNGLIENNFIWNHATPTGGECEKGGICVGSNNDGITVRNNTIYKGVRGITLLGAGRNYKVVNNLIVSTSDAGIWAASGTQTGRINYNNVYGCATPLNFGGTTYGCSAVPGVGTGNKCAATQFVDVSSSIDRWNLHLVSSDSSNRDAGISEASGPLDDIDLQSRTGTPDLGADEIPGGTANPPPPDVSGLRFVP